MNHAVNGARSINCRYTELISSVHFIIIAVIIVPREWLLSHLVSKTIKIFINAFKLDNLFQFLRRLLMIRKRDFLVHWFVLIALSTKLNNSNEQKIIRLSLLSVKQLTLKRKSTCRYSNRAETKLYF